MNKEFWIDGFNFFYSWDKTKDMLRTDSGMDIVKSISRSIGILGRHLGTRCRHTVVYLDGGLATHESTRGALRLRYAGPGRKADDRMVRDLENLEDDARMVTGISNDRELKAGIRLHGASCLGVGEYLSLIEGNKKTGKNGKPGSGKGKRNIRNACSNSTLEDAEIMREKCRNLSPSEVNAWLDFFGGDAEV